MDFDGIRRDVRSIDNHVLRRRVIHDLQALAEDLEIEEAIVAAQLEMAGRRS